MSDENTVYEPTDEEYQLASDWHGGQFSMFHAIASTGALSRGSVRPSTDDGDGWRPMTDEEWSASLLWHLWREVREVVDAAPATLADADIATEWLAKLDILTEDPTAEVQP